MVSLNFVPRCSALNNPELVARFKEERLQQCPTHRARRRSQPDALNYPLTATPLDGVDNRPHASARLTNLAAKTSLAKRPDKIDRLGSMCFRPFLSVPDEVEQPAYIIAGEILSITRSHGHFRGGPLNALTETALNVKQRADISGSPVFERLPFGKKCLAAD